LEGIDDIKLLFPAEGFDATKLLNGMVPPPNAQESRNGMDGEFAAESAIRSSSPRNRSSMVMTEFSTATRVVVSSSTDSDT